MKDYTYYTPTDLVSEILSLLNVSCESTIDICCGSWNLLHTAKNILKCTKVIGVDIDPKVKRFKEKGDIFYLEDGRDYALKRQKKFDLVLSNPPFGNIDENNRKMRDKYKNSSYEKLIFKRYEIEMLFANILLVNEGGILFIILPQTFIRGDLYKKIRMEVAKGFNILYVIKLPDGTFRKKEIFTFAIIMKKENTWTETKLYEAVRCSSWQLNKKNVLTRLSIQEGIWWDDPTTNKKNDQIKIYRGRITSKEFCENGTAKVFHCSSRFVNGAWIPSIRNTDSSKKNQLITRKGDVIINRVGKKAGYWTICKRSGFLLSDCVFIIQQPSPKIMSSLVNNSLNGRLNINSRGVTAAYITKKDISAVLGE